jgi:hypothetical protein
VLACLKGLGQGEVVKTRGAFEGEVADELLIEEEAQGLTLADRLKPDREAL